MLLVVLAAAATFGLLLIGRYGFGRTGVILACLASATLPWNGWIIAGERPGDLFVFAALFCLVFGTAAEGRSTMPAWVWQLAVVILAVAMLHEIVPLDPVYDAGRVVLDAGGQPTVEIQTNAFSAFKFIVAIVTIPAVFVRCVRVDRRAVEWLAVGFAVGVGVSSLVAYTDVVGLTDLGRVLTGRVIVPGRTGGFSNHPNFLAAGCVLALPLAIWMALRPGRRARLQGLVVVVAIVLGVYATGSRGAAVCVPLVVVASFMVSPRLRGYLPALMLVTASTVGLAAIAFPSVVHRVLESTRLIGATGAGSNEVRALLAHQAVRDFRHSPLMGIGLQVVTQAQSVYLQALASGGLILLGSLILYTAAGAVTSYRLMASYPLAAALFVSYVAMIAYNLVGADLTDRFYYVPAGLVVALHARARLDREEELRQLVRRSHSDESGLASSATRM